MKLFIYGLIIGIGKIIPGISGSLLAITLGVYERAIYAITNFFNNPKENTKFLFPLCLGIIVSIIFFSNLILICLQKYYFLSMMLFLGLIISSLLKYLKSISLVKKDYIIIIPIFLITVVLSLLSSNTKIINSSFLIYFLGGLIEIFSSLIPGISGTALLMLLGIYDKILNLIANLNNYSYIIKNLLNYLIYSSGLFISFIITTKLINYMYQKHHLLFEKIILSLSLSSIFLLLKTIIIPNNPITIILGLILLTLGLLFGYIY